MEISVRTAVFLVSDLLLSELQKGAEIVDVNIGDADFGTSYIDDIPHMLRYYFPKLDERTRESYAHLFQALSWMLRSTATEWTVV